MNATHSHCDCCPTTAEYIRQHFDPEGLTRSTEDPAAVLETFSRCFSDEDDCDIDLDDVRAYLDILREEGK